MKQREVILTNFPFSDISEIKARPTIVLSNDDYNDSHKDILVCAVTSNPREYEYSVRIGKNDMETGTLLQSSRIKADKIMLMSKTQTIKTMGKISESKFRETKEKILALISGK